jgi:predicted ATPase/DNA-binding NarL/FixJ family response regulator
MTTNIAISLGNLPAEPNSFVGRERDLAELALLLSDVRALTLCGPGGIGKTRLALRLAWELAPGIPDGAWLAELADTDDPALVPRRVAAALGIRQEPDRPLAETLTEALKPRDLLLVLDNCEHVVDASAALVQQLLAGCPRLRVMATSREPLRVRGETVWRVPPLALPPALGAVPAADPTLHEAIRLFAERAAAVRPGFAIGAENYGAVARLCRTLDGIPLAIELAAARVRALSVEQIAARLGDRFQLLASGDRTAPLRQQTLQAAADWSYELLTEPEQALLRRLSVFSGWNLEMAEQVCADEAIPAGQVLGLLAALIDKSLVTLDGELDGDARYRLLDTIRQYARDRLAASDEEPAIRLRQRDYMLALAERSAAKALLRGDPPWSTRVVIYRRMTADRANFLAALSVCLERGDAEGGLRLCSALRNQWAASGDVTEGASWFDRFLGLNRPVSPSVRARALMRRAGLAFEQQDYDMAGECAQAGLDLCRSTADTCAAAALRVLALVSLRAGRSDEAMATIGAAITAARAAGDDWEEGFALATRAAIIARLGQLHAAQRAYEVALDVLRDNNGYGMAQALYGLGGVARARRDNVAALRHFGDALALYRQIDARPEIARCLAGIGWVALSQQDLELARSSLSECLQLSLAAGQRLAIARGLEAFAVLAVALGDRPRAVKLAGTARWLREVVGDVPSAAASARIRQLLDSARGQLGAAVTAALLDQGRAMSAYEAVRFAVESAADAAADGHGTGPADPADPAGKGSTSAPSVLTGRELEIAALIARGLSNRGIADELVISPATAARHVANIFAKLGFSSRAQLAAWVVEREPAGPA